MSLMLSSRIGTRDQLVRVKARVRLPNRQGQKFG